MIHVKDLLRILLKNKISFYTGVPDSVLKKLADSFDEIRNSKHFIAVNEGAAVSIGMGYHLSTKKIPCIYLQNSGLGNAINPLISIAHRKVYSIPMLLMIGWRGSPKKKDEPQHKAKGAITLNLLKLLNIDYCIARTKKDLSKFNKLIKSAKRNQKIVACLIEKDTLVSRKKKIRKIKKKTSIFRSNFLPKLLKKIKKDSKIISTTGYTSRELMQIREEKKLFKGRDFYMVGGMGHASMVTFGYSLYSKKQIICLDGDGSILMHLGSLRTFGHFGNPNLKHILLNNNSHESVGGQITTALSIDFKQLTKSIGYNNYYKVSNKDKIDTTLQNFLQSKGPSFLEVLISEGTTKNLKRPKNLIQIKKLFMK